ncbi:uncharacterized protein LOC120538617 [Polypterus senegalus]|uniref:uncharacterized protein LOC120538617 n=1 Tax=Polypterus senegalus TaxID=55291 RepID=UPI0019636221|nr:uncharacterized protein LOC120538617 [Polypterus senegalus]
MTEVTGEEGWGIGELVQERCKNRDAGVMAGRLVESTSQSDGSPRKAVGVEETWKEESQHERPESLGLALWLYVPRRWKDTRPVFKVDINIHIRLIPEINWNLRNKIGVFAIKDLLDFYLQQVLKADSHIGKETAELKSHLSRLQTTVKDCIKFTTPSKKYNTTYGEKITDMKKNFKNTDELISKAVGELHLVIEGIHQYTLPRKL